MPRVAKDCRAFGRSYSRGGGTAIAAASCLAYGWWFPDPVCAGVMVGDVAGGPTSQRVVYPQECPHFYPSLIVLTG